MYDIFLDGGSKFTMNMACTAAQTLTPSKGAICSYTENKNLIVVLTFTTYRINLSDFPLNFTVLSVVTTIGIEVICAVKFNTVQFKFSDALLKLTTNSVTSVKN